MTEPWKVLTFDWDGTLVDSTRHIIAAAGEAIAVLGLPERSAEQIREIIGLGARECWERLFPEFAGADYRRFIDVYREQFWALAPPRPRLFPGVRPALQELAGRGFVLAVATGKSRKGLDHDLRHAGLEQAFAWTICADEAHSKPHPSMLRQIAGGLGIDAAELLMIGDTEYDLQMARNAGCEAVAVACGAHDRDRLLALGPLACLEGVLELPAWLRDLGGGSELG